MGKMYVLSSFACMTVLLATGAWAELEGVQPGTSSNPKDNVPKDIQRSTLGDAAYPAGSSGPGTRSDALVDMNKEKPQPATRQDLERNAEKTHGGGAAVAAEDLNEKSKDTSKKQMKRKHSGDTGDVTSKTDRQKFRQQNSDSTAQGQPLINTQPEKTQQPANRPASERGAGSN
ncbi:MAG: hypothetical protein ABI980_08715 [Nitrospirota bacterium]